MRAVVDVPASMTPDEVRQLGAEVESLFQQGISVTCRLVGADLGAVDALARIHLLARRLRGDLQVQGSARAGELLELTGLRGVLQARALEVERQPEAFEELGVQEVVDVGDPSA